MGRTISRFELRADIRPSIPLIYTQPSRGAKRLTNTGEKARCPQCGGLFLAKALNASGVCRACAPTPPPTDKEASRRRL
jgi:hypothetical protein